MAITYTTGSTELLDAVGPLWEKLNAHHAERSSHFASHYADRTYIERKSGLLAIAQTATMRVELAKVSETGQAIAYCISSVTEDAGEIESIYVEVTYRGQGIGDTLMRHALDWLDRHNVSTRRVVVAVGNEQAFGFYARYGFHPRYIILRQGE